MELSVQSCLESLGISLMSEWDVLTFVSNRRKSLTNADHIASLIGYESREVSAALERLEGEKLIERSQASRGVSFYQIPASTDAARQDCILQLISLSKTRAGRVLLAKQLKPLSRNRAEKKLRLDREGKWLCLKAF
jgi:DNA-binding MarR family transcriptional regulator